MQKQPLIEATSLTKYYYDHNNKFKALDHINLEINTGDFICIMGKSGSGKTTLVNILSTIDSPTSGTLKIADKDIQSFSKEELTSFRSNDLGYVFQESLLVDSITLLENISIRITDPTISKKQRIQLIKDIAKQLDIEDILDHYPYQCSIGQIQRAALARSLISKPKLLILDEPTGNLDTNNTISLLQYLQKINNNGTTILMVTHDPICASYSKKMHYLIDGKIIKTIVNQNDDHYYQEILKCTLPAKEVLS